MTSTSCNREGCNCKLFTPNVFKPNYCAFCVHGYSAHHHRKADAAKIRSTASEEPVLQVPNSARLFEPSAARVTFQEEISEKDAREQHNVEDIESNHRGEEPIDAETEALNGEKQTNKVDESDQTQIKEEVSPRKKKKKKKGSSRHGTLKKKPKKGSKRTKAQETKKEDPIEVVENVEVASESDKGSSKKRSTVGAIKEKKKKKKKKGSSRQSRQPRLSKTISQSSVVRLQLPPSSSEESLRDNGSDEEKAMVKSNSTDKLSPRSAELKELTKRMVVVQDELKEFKGSGEKLRKLKRGMLDDLKHQVELLNQQMKNLQELESQRREEGKARAREKGKEKEKPRKGGRDDDEEDEDEEEYFDDAEQEQVIALKKMVVNLTHQIQSLKEEERKQKERKQKELIELEGKVSSLTYQILTLKRRTTTEVEALTKQLQETKLLTKSMSEEMEKELIKEEYTLTYVLRDLETRKTPIDEDLRRSLSSILNSSRENVIKRKGGSKKVKRASQNLNAGARVSKKGNIKKWRSFGDLRSQKASAIRRDEVQSKSLSIKPEEVKKAKKKKDKEKGKEKEKEKEKKEKGSKRKKGSKRSGSKRGGSSRGAGKPVHRKAPKSGTGVFETLSEDLIYRILGRLDAVSLINMSTASSDFLRLCEKDALWESLYRNYEMRLTKQRKRLMKNADFVLANNKSADGEAKNSKKEKEEKEEGEGDGEKEGGAEAEEGTSSEVEENGTNEQVPPGSSGGTWKERFRGFVEATKKEQIILKSLIFELSKQTKKDYRKSSGSLRNKGKLSGSSTKLRTRIESSDKAKIRPRKKGKEKMGNGENGNGEAAGGKASRLHLNMVVKEAPAKEKPPQFSFRVRKVERDDKQAGHNSKHLVKLLLYGLNQQAQQPAKIPFLITKATEGLHEEPAYHCNILTYGGCPEILELSCEADAFYTLMTYDLLPERRREATTFYAILLSNADVTTELRVRKPWKHSLSIEGEWKTDSAGGCLNEKTFSKNPFFLLSIPKSVPSLSRLPVCMMLEQKKDPSDVIPGQIVPYEIYIGFYIFDTELSRDMGINIRWKNCHKVHANFALNVKKDRSFLIVPTTFKPKQETSFTLHVLCDYPATLELY